MLQHHCVSSAVTDSCPCVSCAVQPYLLDACEWQLVVLELSRICTNLLNLQVLLLPKHPELDALLLQLLLHSLCVASRVVLRNL